LKKKLIKCSLFSDVRISDRLDEIDKWRKTLEYTIQDVDREIQAIQSAKEQCERYLEHMRSPLGISSLQFTSVTPKKFFFSDATLENHVTRDGRKAIDNVDDEAERELKKVSNSLTLNQIEYFLQGSLCH
jgi:lysyl-tRNA synthetase class I